MAETKNQPEPSMEEILASIRRIIAEDSEPGAAPAASAEAAAPTPPPSPPPPPPPPEPSVAAPTLLQPDRHETDTEAVMPAASEDVLELTQIVADDPAPAPIPLRPPPEPRIVMVDEDRLVSDATAAASTAAFASVADILKSRRTNEVGLGNPNITLEEIVRELLRPMLQGWLDEHLPDMVRALVQDEIRRLSRDAF